MACQYCKKKTNFKYELKVPLNFYMKMTEKLIKLRSKFWKEYTIKVNTCKGYTPQEACVLSVTGRGWMEASGMHATLRNNMDVPLALEFWSSMEVAISLIRMLLPLCVKLLVVWSKSSCEKCNKHEANLIIFLAFH